MPRRIYESPDKHRAYAHKEMWERHKAIADKQRRLGEDEQVLRVRPETRDDGSEVWVVWSFDRQEWMYGLREDYGDDAPF